MKTISYLKNLKDDIVCRIYPSAKICPVYIPETHPNFFMRKSMIDSLKTDLEKDAEVNVIFGTNTYSLIRENSSLAKEYENLIGEGLLAAFNPEISKNELVDYEGVKVDSRYTGGAFISTFEKPLAEREMGRIGKRKSKDVSDILKNSVPVEDFSASVEELERKFHAMKNKIL